MAMLFPTYGDIIRKANENSEDGKPVIDSRYSVVLAAAKRARQLVDGAPALVREDGDKPLSVAIRELSAGSVKILRKEDD